MTLAARLPGLVTAQAAARRIVRPGDPLPTDGADPSRQPIAIGDARALQAACGSAAACFDRHGFALLGHRSAVTDWRQPCDIRQTYHAEIDRLIRQQLLPGRPVEIAQCFDMVHRGGGDDVIYADGVHQDFGLTADDFALNLAVAADAGTAKRWRSRYAANDVTGCIAVSFWRTTGMAQPLRHKPLALCDPASVDIADVLPAASPTGGGRSYHIALRYDPGQRWYHYSHMRADEVLVFTLFDCRKADPAPSRLRSVFHTAFDDPGMPADAERRHSCEHRAIVTLLAN